MPVLAVSAHDDIDERARVIAAGFEDFETMGMNSPGRQRCCWCRIEMSLRKSSAWPQVRQIRVPRGISPRPRRERVPPPDNPPVLSSFAQTKSVPLQLVQVGATAVPLTVKRRTPRQ